MMIAWAAAFIFLGFFSLARWRLNFSLAALLAISPAYIMRFKLGGILPSTWLEMAFLGIILALLSLIIFKPSFRTDFKNRCLNFYQKHKLLFFLSVLLFISSLISCFVSPDLINALGLVRAYIWEPLIYFYLILLYWEKSDLKFAFYLLIPTFLLIDLLALNQAINGYGFMEMAGTNVNWRATSLYPYPNAIGLFLAPASIFLLALLSEAFKNKKYWKFLALIILLGFNIWTIYAAQSEAALLAIIIGLGLFILTRKKGIYLGIIGVILATMVFSYFQLWPKIINKITLQDFSGQIRRQMILETGSMIKDNFFLGAGFGAYQTAVKPYHWEVLIFTDEAGKLYEQPVEIYMYPHNLFLNFWSELGFPGFLILISLLLLITLDSLRSWWKSKDEYLLASLLALMVLLIHSLVDVALFKNDLALLFFFILAINCLLHKLPNSAEKA